MPSCTFLSKLISVLTRSSICPRPALLLPRTSYLMNFLSHNLHIVSMFSAHITLLGDVGEGLNRIFYLWQVKVCGQKNSMNVCFLSLRPRWKDFGFLSWSTSPKCFHKSDPSSLHEMYCYNKWDVENYSLHSRTWSLSIGLVRGRGSWKMSGLHRIPRAQCSTVILQRFLTALSIPMSRVLLPVCWDGYSHSGFLHLCHLKIETIRVYEIYGERWGGVGKWITQEKGT